MARVAIGVTGGLLGGLSLPRASIWIAIFASVILIHLAVRRTGFWSGFGIGVASGFALYFSQSAWMTAYLGPVPLAALATLESVIFGLGLGVSAATWRLLRRHHRGLGNGYYLLTGMSLSLIWVAREWIACRWPYGGYQWSQLAQSVADTSLASLAFWGGLPFVSFSVVALSTGLLLWAEAKPWRINEGGRYWARSFAALGSSVVLLLLTLATPMAQALTIKPTELPAIRVVAIQGNAKAGLFANPVPGSIMVKHLAQTEAFLRANGGKKIDLMVWPENSVDISPLANTLVAAELKTLSNRIGAPLLVGSVVERYGRYFNESLLYEPGFKQPKTYDKRRPVPFGEYVPDREFFRSLAPQLVDMIYRGYTPGNRVGTFDIASTRIGDLICFEIGIDDITQDLVKNGSTVIVSQANNADFGRTDEAFQQEALLRLQAIATGKPIVHASTVATTEIVTATGQVTTTTVPFEADAAVALVKPNTARTPASIAYGWMGWISLAGLLVAVGFVLRASLLSMFTKFLARTK